MFDVEDFNLKKETELNNTDNSDNPVSGKLIKTKIADFENKIEYFKKEQNTHENLIKKLKEENRELQEKYNKLILKNKKAAMIIIATEPSI